MSTFSVVSNYSTTLSSPMTSTQLTVPVNSIVTRDATPVTLTDTLIGDGWYLTIDPGTNSEEFVKIIGVTAGAGSGGTFTVAALGRGLAYSGATDAQVSGNAKTHNPGAIVLLSNPKNLFNKLVDIESAQSIDGVKTFTESPQVPTPTSAEVNAAASVQYVNDVAVAGAPNAAIGVKGIVEIGTQTQVDTGNDTGSTDALSVVTPSTHFETWDLEVTNDFTYGDTISVGDLLYLDTATGKWKLASAALLSTCDGPLGFALDAGVDTDTGKRVQINGVVTGLSGLTAGWVYVSDTPGALSASAGTIKKVVGYAPNAATLEIQNGLGAEELTGGSADLTTTTINRAGTFFKDPFKQGIKTTVTAGQDLAAGDIVALESDGKAYRVRPKGFSTANAGTASDLTNVQLGEVGKMFFFDSATPTIKSFLGQDKFPGSERLKVTRITTDGDFNAISSTASSTVIFSNSITSNQSATLFNTDKVAACVRAATGSIEAACCENITTTPSWGSVIVLETGSTGAAITDTSVTDTLVAFANDGSQIKSYRITNSGNTLTESTNATFLIGANLEPISAKRFAGTDFIAVVYINTSSNTMFLAIGEYVPASGTWVSVGTPVTIASTGLTGNAQAMMESISSTQIAIAYQQNSTGDLSVVVATRSGVTASLGTAIVAATGITTSSAAMTFKKLGSKSFFVGGASTAGGKLQTVALDRDVTIFSLVGSVLTNTASAARGIAGCMLYPGRWLALYQTDTTTTSINTREMSINLDSVIGVTESAIASDATGNVITTGYSSSLSGLSAGTGYYTGIDGQPTVYGYGTAPFLNNASSSPLVRRVFSAISATEVIVSL